ncbi:MAG: glycosyltransferase family 2 protein [Candidatus Binataceae bacterium]
MSTITALIPTCNEEINLHDCLASLRGWVDEIFVVDSFSTDRTCEIARAAGARVVQHEYRGPAEQKNWALDNLPIKSDWILILDADERVGAELRDEILGLVASNPDYQGFHLNRLFIFYGRPIRHCGWYPSWVLRLFRRGVARYENRAVHEHMLVSGPVGFCRADLLHEDRRDLTHWIDKHNRYSSLEASEMMRARTGESRTALRLHGPLAFKRLIKERLWPYLPGRALIYFLYLYVVRLGFLDGVAGWRFCLMHASVEFWTSMKYWELRNWKDQAPPGAIAVPRYFVPDSPQSQQADEGGSRCAV